MVQIMKTLAHSHTCWAGTLDKCLAVIRYKGVRLDIDIAECSQLFLTTDPGKWLQTTSPGNLLDVVDHNS